MRTFIAIDLQDEIQAALACEQARMKAACRQLPRRAVDRGRAEGEARQAEIRRMEERFAVLRGELLEVLNERCPEMLDLILRVDLFRRWQHPHNLAPLEK